MGPYLNSLKELSRDNTQLVPSPSELDSGARVSRRRLIRKRLSQAKASSCLLQLNDEEIRCGVAHTFSVISPKVSGSYTEKFDVVIRANDTNNAIPLQLGIMKDGIIK